ncbi:asparaginase [Agromyces albus]|uniref:Asparaginase n=1 Tax=Agromyces albus TaxID=205332 RepID=A0A4V1QY94_9MICO|nr:asparaginase [Agromyces albus]RXZ72366.1 asparaginase [Agromyces albus]
MQQSTSLIRPGRRRRISFAAAAAIVGGAIVSVPTLAAAATPATAIRPAAYSVPEYPITPIGPERDKDKPDIVVIDAGGTLTSRARDRISYLHYSGSVDGGVQTILQDMYPELAQVANLEVVAVGGLGSSSRVTNETLYNVSRTVDAQLARNEVDGVVVTAGTNVLEEDAYFFDLTVQSDKPVVVTGSMHQYGTFTYDAYTNLFSSIRLAASGKTTCFGTVVLLNDQFFSARDVTKTDGYRMDTFETRAYGALGVVNEDNIRPMKAPARVMNCGTDAWKPPFDLSKTEPAALARVDIVNGYVEASAETISGPVAGGAQGIVTAGHGPGGLSYLQSPARDEAIKNGVLFVSATRTGGEGTYDTGEGVIGAGDLLPQKARILLQLGLTFSDDSEQIRGWFSSLGNAEFDMSDVGGVNRGNGDGGSSEQAPRGPRNG